MSGSGPMDSRKDVNDVCLLKFVFAKCRIASKSLVSPCRSCRIAYERRVPIGLDLGSRESKSCTIVTLSFWIIRSETSSGCGLDLGQQGAYLPDTNTPLSQNHGVLDIAVQINGDDHKAVGNDRGRGQGVLG